MDTGNIMEDQYHQQNEAWEHLMNEICEEAIALYKNKKLTPKDLLTNYNKLKEENERLRKSLNDVLFIHRPQFYSAEQKRKEMKIIEEAYESLQNTETTK